MIDHSQPLSACQNCGHPESSHHKRVGCTVVGYGDLSCPCTLYLPEKATNKLAPTDESREEPPQKGYGKIVSQHFMDALTGKPAPPHSQGDYTVEELLEKYKKHAYEGEVEQTIDYLNRLIEERCREAYKDGEMAGLTDWKEQTVKAVREARLDEQNLAERYMRSGNKVHQYLAYSNRRIVELKKGESDDDIRPPRR